MSQDAFTAGLVNLSEDDFTLYIANLLNSPLEPDVATMQLGDIFSTPPDPRLHLKYIDTAVGAWSTAVDNATAAEADGSFLATPVSTVASEDAASEGGTSATNKSPCGACQKRKRRCKLVRTEPNKLCEYCETKGKTECPSHVPAKAVRDVYGDEGSSKGPSKAGSQDRFIYESMA